MEKSPEQLLALKICRDLFLFSIQTPTVYFHNMNIFIYVCMQFCYGPFCTTYSYWADMFKKLVSFFIQKLSCWRVNVCIKNWKALETFRLGLFYVYTKPFSCCSSKIFTWLRSSLFKNKKFMLDEMTPSCENALKIYHIFKL